MKRRIFLVCLFYCFFRLPIYESIAAIFWQSPSYVFDFKQDTLKRYISSFLRRILETQLLLDFIFVRQVFQCSVFLVWMFLRIFYDCVSVFQKFERIRQRSQYFCVFVVFFSQFTALIFSQFTCCSAFRWTIFCYYKNIFRKIVFINFSNLCFMQKCRDAENY